MRPIELIRAEHGLLTSMPIYGWTRPFWTVAFGELWCSWICGAWGLQLIFVHRPAGMEPVSNALYSMAHVPTSIMGMCLIVLALLQLVSLYFWHRMLRLVCLLAALAFFLFVTLAFWRSASYLPGAFICPTYAAAMLIRFIQIAGRRE